ncbi:phosphoadenosine phosphosulfate reductase domain-containing protein, partial [Streptomyces nigra]
MTTTVATPQEGTDSPYALSHLDALESEAVHIFREVAGEFERPVILFSGGKDSIVMLHLALKAFAPAPVPFSLLHVDTGHNFPEVIEYRDRTVEKHQLPSASPSTEAACSTLISPTASPAQPHGNPASSD